MGVPVQRAEAALEMILEGARSLHLTKKIKEKEYISLEGAGVAGPEDESSDPDELTDLVDEHVQSDRRPGREPEPSFIVNLGGGRSSRTDSNKRVFITATARTKNSSILLRRSSSYAKV